MKLWILSTVPPISEDTAYLIGRSASRSTRVLVSTVTATDDEPPPPPAEDIDIILNRSFNARGSFLQRLDALAAEFGVPVSNPGAATARACDKRTYIEDFPAVIPQTRIVKTLDDTLRLQREMGEELVLKDPFGKHGKDIIRFRGQQDCAEAADLITRMGKAGIVAQSFCGGFVDGDKRVILQRSRCGELDIVAWFRRIPKAGEWKSNVSAGGQIERCELETEEKNLALAVAETAGLDCIGIDMAWHDGRCLLIETNAYTGGHINFDTDRRVHSGDDFALLLVSLAEHGRP